MAWSAAPRSAWLSRSGVSAGRNESSTLVDGQGLEIGCLKPPRCSVPRLAARRGMSKASGWVVAVLSDYATVLELPVAASALVVVPAVAAAPERAVAPTAEFAAGAAVPAAAFSLRLPVVLPAVAAAPEYVAVPTVELAAGAVPVPAAAFEPHPPVVWRAGRGHA